MHGWNLIWFVPAVFAATYGIFIAWLAFLDWLYTRDWED